MLPLSSSAHSPLQPTLMQLLIPSSPPALRWRKPHTLKTESGHIDWLGSGIMFEILLGPPCPWSTFCRREEGTFVRMQTADLLWGGAGLCHSPWLLLCATLRLITESRASQSWWLHLAKSNISPQCTQPPASFMQLTPASFFTFFHKIQLLKFSP